MNVNVIVQFFIEFALALTVGALIGIEREHARYELEKSGKIKGHVLGPIFGIRSTILFSMLGFLFAVLTRYLDNNLLMIVGLVFALTISTSVYLANVWITKHTGATTYIAVLIVFFLGALIGFGGYDNYVAAGTIAIIMTSLLALKRKLVGFTTKLTNEEIISALKFGIVAFVIYPLLPNRIIDPWGILNPSSIWFVVVAVSAIYFLSYILLREFSHKGLEISAFFGGLINSSATVFSLASIVKEKKKLAFNAAVGVYLTIFATIVSDFVLIIFVLNSMDLMMKLLLPYVVAMTIPLIAVIWCVEWQKKSVVEHVKMASPFAFKSALQFASIYIILLVVSTFIDKIVGPAGLAISTIVGSLWSSSTVILSLGSLSNLGIISKDTTAQFVILAVLVSILVKIAWARTSLNKEFSNRVTKVVLLTAAAFAITAFVQFFIL